MLDLRKPIAILFLLLGALLAGYGILFPDVHAEISPGFNVDLAWGAALGVFGGVLGVLSRKS